MLSLRKYAIIRPDGRIMDYVYAHALVGTEAGWALVEFTLEGEQLLVYGVQKENGVRYIKEP